MWTSRRWGASFVDITLQTNAFGINLNGLNLSYNDVAGVGDNATVDASGVSGSTGGALMFTLANPATQLNFNFSILGVLAPAVDGVTIDFSNAGVLVNSQIVPANTLVGGDATGTVAYNGAAFDQVTMLFSLDSPFFALAPLSYGSDPLAVTVTSAPPSGAAPLPILLTAAATGGLGTYTYAWTSSPAVTFSDPTLANRRRHWRLPAVTRSPVRSATARPRSSARPR